MDSFTNLTDTEVIGLAGLLGGFLIICFAFVMIWCILQIIAMWKIFIKAGEKGWKSIIPFYNMYTQFKFSWSISKFWAMLIVIFIVIIGEIIMSIPVISLLGALITIVAGIVLVIYSIKQNLYLAKAFGKGTGFGIGLFLVQPIFLLILAFDNSKYLGNKSVQ